MGLVAVSRLISVCSAVLVLSACVADEWTDHPTGVPPPETRAAPAATTRGGGTSLVSPDAVAPRDDGGDRSAKSDIRAFAGGTIKGTAQFTQHGADVSARVDLVSCAEGTHLIQIFGGYSCDSEASQGSVWDPPRGENFGSEDGTINCGADGKGSLSFIRRGGDAPSSWTVGDQNAATDITRELIVVFAAGDPMHRHGCGDFR